LKIKLKIKIFLDKMDSSLPPIASLNNLSKTILEEIEYLPNEFRQKSEEVQKLRQELNELKIKYNKKENLLNKTTKDIINIESDLVYNYDELDNAKSEQKILINELNEESFNLFRNNFYKLDEEYYKRILCFLKYENIYEDELNFLLLKTEDLNSLLRDSYSYFKSIEDKEKYQELKNKILNIQKGNTIKLNFKKNNLHKSKPFNIILNFIDNTFKIIDINNKIKEMKLDINEKNEIKENLFIEIKILKNDINEKNNKLDNINIYTKRINNILIKFNKFFANNENIKIQNHNINNIENNNNSEKKLFYLKDTNTNILIDNNKIINSNLNYHENNSNNFYVSVNNCSKDNKIMNKSFKSNSSLDISTSNISPNNIKIISINSNSNPGNSRNPKKNSIPNTPNNPNILKNNRVNMQMSASSSNESKKIKIGSLPLYQSSSTAQKYKNKIIKTNSYEKEDSKKMFFCNDITPGEKNKSFYKSENNHLINENNIENNLPRTNQLLYQSLKISRNNLNNNFDKEIKIKKSNKIKIINVKKDKIDDEDNIEIEDNEKDKETIVDNYNNNILVEFKKDENNNKNTKLFSNGSIYNNNRKIKKIIENNKFNNKK
jgi:hypothetical protein